MKWKFSYIISHILFLFSVLNRKGIKARQFTNHLPCATLGLHVFPVSCYALKNKWKLCLLCFSGLTMSVFAKAQNFSAYPPATRWKQINSDTARVIFTAGTEEQAQKVAALLHKAAADTPFALGRRLRKINVVLHSGTTLANGYVGLAPFRSEYYLIPPSNVFEFGNLPWYRNLAIHEYRHVQQYNNLRNGASKGLSYLFGEQGQALGNALSVPDWFFEGDAVHSETTLTHGGRGRLSNFLSSYNSLFLQQKNYSWQKLRNGSLKDYVPNHYPLGYLLVNYGYLKYGNDFWGKVVKDASAFNGLFYPFQRAVKQYAGVDFRTFRKEAFAYYKNGLPKLQDTVSVKSKTVSNCYFPQFINDDSLIYLKTAYNKIPAFYIKDKTGEHKIALRNISAEEWFSYNRGQVAYTAYSTDARWSLTDYSDIVLLNIGNRSSKRITHHRKYYTPDFSPRGNLISAIMINDSLQTEWHILNATTGAIEQKIALKDGWYVTNPRFVDEERLVAGVRTDDEKQSLQLLNRTTGRWEVLIPANYNTVGNPTVQNGYVYFTGNFSGNDEIYRMHLRSKRLEMITHSATGNYYPAVSQDSVVWSHFRAEGLLLKGTSAKLRFQEIDIASLVEHPAIYPVAGGKKTYTALPVKRYAMKRYNKSTGLFNFHSWSPGYEDPEFTLSLLGNNILNTFSSEVYYRYNQNESSHALGFSAAYGGLFPVIRAGAEYNFNRQLRRPSETIYLDGAEVRIGYTIPLNFTKGTSYKSLNFGSDFVFNRTIFKDSSKFKYNNYNVSYLAHTISWAHYRPKALQHIYPKLGYAASAGFRHLLGRDGYQLTTAANIFLPSFGNHSIVLSGAFQQVDTSNTVFSNRFANSRGYEDYYFSKMWKLGANYHFPIAYPDFGIASILYFQRVRGNLFYDLTRVYNNKRTANLDLRSTGAEVFFDTKWWNQLPVTFGIRYSYLLDADLTGNNRISFDLILPLDLIP